MKTVLVRETLRKCPIMFEFFYARIPVMFSDFLYSIAHVMTFSCLLEPLFLYKSSNARNVRDVDCKKTSSWSKWKNWKILTVWKWVIIFIYYRFCVWLLIFLSIRRSANINLTLLMLKIHFLHLRGCIISWNWGCITYFRSFHTQKRPLHELELCSKLMKKLPFTFWYITSSVLVRFKKF